MGFADPPDSEPSPPAFSRERRAAELAKIKTHIVF
jgi:hypothetical protein